MFSTHDTDMINDPLIFSFSAAYTSLPGYKVFKLYSNVSLVHPNGKYQTPAGDRRRRCC